ncbi:3,4-dihydroxyphenylacetaldehyde synthase 2 [Halyomorpha halys]|uniref:3,4-dihydroxyphenylacetaldehyde synthase 2 n=1 Tax=Halyomorpha halys TaxID=286706 RepID=UPI0034D1ADF8
MDPEDFRQLAKDAIDYIVDYTESVRNRTVLPKVEPGYLHQIMPKEAPEHPDDWRQIIPDIEEKIMPGITHWNSPMFNAYFPAGHSYPSVIGDLLCSGIGCVGFNWLLSPACTELEVIVLDWLAKMMDLPDFYLASSNGPGGGIMQTSGSEGILVALLIAKQKLTRQLLENDSSLDENTIRGKLIAYSSDQSNSCVEKAGLLGSMKTRLLPSDKGGRLTGATLLDAITEDKEAGLIPCFVVATLGTTGTCAFDDLSEIGPICHKEGIWLHVDAAYAGAAFICPEYRYLMKGIELSDSVNMNPHKWLLVNFDCSVFWIKDRRYIQEAFSVDRIYLRDRGECIEKWAPDFRNWEISLGRRFRALKLWFTLRLYGVSGLQDYIRNHILLAKHFESLVRKDARFEIVAPASMGLVCFRMNGPNKLTSDLLKILTESKEIFMNQGKFGEKNFIRYAICSRIMCEGDVDRGWEIISSHADIIWPKHSLDCSALLMESAAKFNQWNQKRKEKIIPR